MTQPRPTEPDPTDLLTALGALTDIELGVLIAHVMRAARHFADDGRTRVAAVCAAAAVLGAEQQDRRRDLSEHARLALCDDGEPAEGRLLQPGDDPFAE